MRSLLLAAAALAPLPAAAQDFNCRNLGAEIRCGEGACEIAKDQGFTPMGLARRGNLLSICAYSGCSEGRITTRRSLGGLTLLYANVRRTEPRGAGPEPLAVIHDRAQRTAQMRWGGFSNAMTCD
jgi:hypothetical protein